MSETPCVLALDVGEKTIGLALSRAGGAFPTPLPTLHRTSLKSDLETLEKLAAEHRPDLLLVGYPVHVSGEVGQAVRRVEKVARKLAGRLRLPVFGVDERYSSCEAEEILQAGRGRKSRRGPDDHALAAVLIMERWRGEGEPAVLARWIP